MRELPRQAFGFVYQVALYSIAISVVAVEGLGNALLNRNRLRGSDDSTDNAPSSSSVVQQRDPGRQRPIFPNNFRILRPFHNMGNPLEYIITHGRNIISSSQIVPVLAALITSNTLSFLSEDERLINQLTRISNFNENEFRNFCINHGLDIEKIRRLISPIVEIIAKFGLVNERATGAGINLITSHITSSQVGAIVNKLDRHAWRTLLAKAFLYIDDPMLRDAGMNFIEHLPDRDLARILEVMEPFITPDKVFQFTRSMTPEQAYEVVEKFAGELDFFRALKLITRSGRFAQEQARDFLTKRGTTVEDRTTEYSSEQKTVRARSPFEGGNFADAEETSSRLGAGRRYSASAAYMSNAPLSQQPGPSSPPSRRAVNTLRPLSSFSNGKDKEPDEEAHTFGDPAERSRHFSKPDNVSGAAPSGYYDTGRR